MREEGPKSLQVFEIYEFVESHEREYGVDEPRNIFKGDLAGGRSVTQQITPDNWPNTLEMHFTHFSVLLKGYIYIRPLLRYILLHFINIIEPND